MLKINDQNDSSLYSSIYVHCIGLRIFFEGEGYEDPSVERVSLFGDRDDVQGDLFVKVCCFCCWFTNDEVDDDDGDTGDDYDHVQKC